MCQASGIGSPADDLARVIDCARDRKLPGGVARQERIEVRHHAALVQGTFGAVTLTKVKHGRELLLAALPILFAVHQFIEGFVWLGLDGKSKASRL